jgi:hypothetical protein
MTVDTYVSSVIYICVKPFCACICESMYTSKPYVRANKPTAQSGQVTQGSKTREDN